MVKLGRKGREGRREKKRKRKTKAETEKWRHRNNNRNGYEKKIMTEIQKDRNKEDQ